MSLNERQETPLETISPTDTAREIIWGGGPIDRTSASLRFFAEDLDPSTVTSLLQHKPTRARRKGDLIPSRISHRMALEGAWILASPLSKGDTLELHIAWLLDQVSDDLSAWAQITASSRADIFCGVFLQEWNRGFSLTSSLMLRVAERGLTLEFDIYCDAEEETEATGSSSGEGI